MTKRGILTVGDFYKNDKFGENSEFGKDGKFWRKWQIWEEYNRTGLNKIQMR